MANQLTPNNPLVQEIRELVKNARTTVAQQVNTQLLSTYWQIGRAIVEYEQQNQLRAEYGKQTLKELAKEPRTRSIPRRACRRSWRKIRSSNRSSAAMRAERRAKFSQGGRRSVMRERRTELHFSKK